MVPILSFLWLRRRCGSCDASIPSHLARIEGAAIAVALAAVVAAHGTLHLWALVLSFWCLAALFYTDLLVMRLPDPLTFALAVFALAVTWAAPDRTVAEAALTGLGTVLAFLLLRLGYAALRQKEGLGLGDVKLAMGFGALLGWQLVPLGLLIAAGLALCVAMIEKWRGAVPISGTTAIPFGSYMCGAALLLSIL